MTDPHHVHPRNKRTAKPYPYKKLFQEVVPVRVTGARPKEDYRAYKRNRAESKHGANWIKRHAA